MSVLTPSPRTARTDHRTRWLALGLALPLVLPAVAAIPGTEIVDRAAVATYVDANGNSTGPLATSGDGRYLLFASAASNLVPGDGNGLRDLFLHDRNSGALERVNLANDGGEADAELPPNLSPRAGVSADGRYVMFASLATNLVAESTNGQLQIYQRDRVSGTTTLISRGSDGLPADSRVYPGAMTPDGRYSVFVTSATNFPGAASSLLQAYRRDNSDGSLTLITVSIDSRPAYADIYNLAISDDGRFVLFSSYADNLVPGTPPPGMANSFLRDVIAGTTQQVSVTDTGAPGPATYDLEDIASVNRLSSDGRYVVFSTRAALSAADTDSLFDVYRFDRLSGTTTLVSDFGSGGPADVYRAPSISADGRYVSFVSLQPPPELSTRLYVRDMTTGTQTPLALPAMRMDTGVMQSLSRDASTVFFSTVELPPLDGMYQVYRFDRTTSQLTRPSQAPAWSMSSSANGHSDMQNPPSLSAHGQFVAFASDADNLVNGDDNGVSDIFVRDRSLSVTERISRRADGSESPCASKAPTITPDARYVVFESCGALVAPASGNQTEVYRYDRASQTLDLVSIAAGGVRADSSSAGAHVSEDGRHVAFTSCARNLVPIVGGAQCQIYLRDMDTGTTVLASHANDGQPANSGYSADARVSGDGRFVGYTSSASNLVANDTNNAIDAFVFDRVSDTTERVSVGASGEQNRDSSLFFRGFDHGGNLALFQGTSSSFASGGSPIVQRTYLRNRGAGTTTAIVIPGDDLGGSKDPAISPDGRVIAFIGRYAKSGASAFDDSSKDKLFVLDRNDGRYRALTWFTREGPQSETVKPALSADGLRVAFASTRPDLTDDDFNGQFADIFLTRVEDSIFANGFD